jgi:hypothetical protein
MPYTVAVEFEVAADLSRSRLPPAVNASGNGCYPASVIDKSGQDYAG